MTTKKQFLIGAIGALTLFSCKNSPSSIVLKSNIDSVSYSIGVSLGQNLKQAGLDSLNTDIIGKAISHVVDGGDILLDDKQSNEIIQAFLKGNHEKKYGANKRAGMDFLASNKSKEGVIELPSGLQYQIIKEGKGAKPTANDMVKTHYHGTTIDGKVFDSSVERGEPATFPVSGVIQGWTEVLQLMPVGSKWKVFVPYQLAYGEQGAPPSIEPYSTLIFEIELLNIEKQKPVK